MGRLVKLTLESGYSQTVRVADNYKIHDALVTAESPSSWVIIPSDTGGAFAARAATIISIAMEDEIGPGGSP